MSEKQRNTIDKFIKKNVYFLSYPRLDIITTLISRPINIAKIDSLIILLGIKLIINRSMCVLELHYH